MERVLELKDFNVTYVNKYKKVYAVKNANLKRRLPGNSG
mgnify:CR=1 FL=1